MYTATLKNRIIEGGVIRWVVGFSKGEEYFTESFIVNKYSDLQPRVARRLAELNYEDTFTIDGIIDPTLPVEPVVSQADLDRMEWLQDWRKLETANKLIANGIILDTLPGYITLKNKVTSDFKPSYLNFL